jgi:hypothetical protein
MPVTATSMNFGVLGRFGFVDSNSAVSRIIPFSETDRTL